MIGLETVVLATFLTAGAERLSPSPANRLRRIATTYHETPLPDDAQVTLDFSATAGELVEVPDLSDSIRGSLEYIHDLAVIEIDEKIDREITELLIEHAPKIEGARALTRRFGEP